MYVEGVGHDFLCALFEVHVFFDGVVYVGAFMGIHGYYMGIVVAL
jgi:hypothetical protein